MIPTFPANLLARCAADESRTGRARAFLGLVDRLEEACVEREGLHGPPSIANQGDGGDDTGLNRSDSYHDRAVSGAPGGVLPP